MRRGEIYTLRDGGYASKARPVIVIQDENAGTFDSIILCLLTSFDSQGIKTRVKILPSRLNGLQKESYAMSDKIVTVDKSMLGKKVGELEEEYLKGISESLIQVLGLGKR